MKRVDELNPFELSVLKTHEPNIDQIEKCEVDFENCKINIQYKQPVETITFRAVRSKEESYESKSDE